MTQYAMAWRAAGACRTVDPDLFFPVAPATGTTRQVSKAQRICAGCPVRQQCLEFAMQTHESNGIWGGTTPEERSRARRNLAAARRRRARREATRGEQAA
ncbi:MAG TPA: WhiB family transcriptional regulator [Trebonia sp.]|jgi:WhiB family redox-sensing transcriptional regulator|nr:WhiB family transcriptional regulator [Trebonia sp.]